MSVKHTSPVDNEDGLSKRQDIILDAAKTCFVRSGFDRTTMQEIAREAKMSSPNIYRYFSSKESLVIGLATRDSKRYDFIVEPLENSGAGADAIIEVFKRYFATFDRESALLRVDLWLNATRNPKIAEIEALGQEASNAWLAQTLKSLATSPDCDPCAILEVIDPILRGLTLSFALTPGYDPTLALDQLRKIIESGLAGHLVRPL